MSAQPIRSLDAVSDRPNSLSDALLFLAAFHGRVMTRDALLAGLPIDDNRLTVALLGRAAGRAGLEVEPVKRAIGDIPALVLPALLVSADQSARILTKIDAVTQKLTLVDPTTREQIEGGPPPSNTMISVTSSSSGLPRRQANERPQRETSEIALVLGCRSPLRNELQPRRHCRIHCNVLGLAAPLFTMNVYDRVVPNGAIPSLAALAIGLALAIVFDFMLRTVARGSST